MSFVNNSSNFESPSHRFDSVSQGGIWLAFSSVMVASIIGNGVVIWIILAHAQMRSSTNFFLLNLSVSDILLMVLQVVPNVSYTLSGTWNFGLFYCRLSNFLTTFSISLSVFTFMAIAFERYVVIIYPLRPRPGRATIIASLVFIWFFSAGTAAPVTWYSFTEQEKENEIACKLVESSIKAFNWVLIILQCLIPLCVVSFIYVVISIRLWQQQPIGEQISAQGENIRAKRKIVKMMIIVVLIFALCWIPYQMIFFITAQAEGFITTYFIALCSTVPNPFIYCKMNRNFRLGFKRAFAWCPFVTLDMEKYQALKQGRHSAFTYSFSKTDPRSQHQQSLFAREQSRRMQRSRICEPTASPSAASAEIPAIIEEGQV